MFEQLKHLSEDVAVLQQQLQNDRLQRSAKIVNDKHCKSIYTLDREYRFKMAQIREKSLLNIRNLSGRRVLSTVDSYSSVTCLLLSPDVFLC